MDQIISEKTTHIRLDNKTNPVYVVYKTHLQKNKNTEHLRIKG